MEGNKDALDSAFLPSADPDMRDVMVCPHNTVICCHSHPLSTLSVSFAMPTCPL